MDVGEPAAPPAEDRIPWMQAELRKHAQAGLKLFCHDKNNNDNNNTDVDRQQQLESLFDAVDFNCSGLLRL